MRKFIGLIVNEYIKVYMKISTKIMLIAIIIVAFGYTGIMSFADSMNKRYIETYYEDIDTRIERAKNEKYEGWEREVEVLTYMRDNNITQDYKDPDYWKNAAVYELFDLKFEIAELLEEDSKRMTLQKQFDEMEKVIKDNDWKGYLNIHLGNLKEESQSLLSDEEKEFQEVAIWGYQYRLDNDIAPNANEWKSNLIDEIGQRKQNLIYLKTTDSGNQYKAEIAEEEEGILIATYRLDHDLETYTSEAGSDAFSQTYDNASGFDFWSVFSSSTAGISVINVLIIVIAGSAISAEFSGGTVKFLLINPVKRWKIFVAKYISIITTALVMLLVYYLFSALLSGVFFGFKDIGAPYLHISGDKILEGSSFLFVARKYLIGSVGMICMATFAFAISSLVRNSALSIGLGVFLMLTGSTVVQILKGMLNLDWARYILFANTNLNTIISGNSIFKNHTLSFALINISIYMLVFLLTAWDGFVRRDIK